MVMNLFFLVPILLTVFYFLYSLYAALSSPLRSVPGPFLARFTRLWYLRRVSKGQFEKENIALHRKYGPIVRLTPNMYSIDAPEVVQLVYGVGSKFAKSDWYDGWRHPNQELWTLFPDRNIKRHHETKKAFQPLYSMSAIVRYENHVSECTDILIQKLDNFASSGTTVDLGHWLQCYAFDVMSSITYSERFGFLDVGEDVNGIMTALRKHMRYASQVGIYPEIHPWIYGLLGRFKSSGAYSRNLLVQLVGQKIAQRRKYRAAAASEKGDVEKTFQPLTSKTDDFLNKMIIANEQDPDKVTPYMVFMMALANIIAGADTTATSLSGIIYHLLRNPTTLMKLRQEIEEVTSARNLINSRINFQEAQAMPYLQAVIKEGLRMHPAVGLPLWREVPAGGVQICGQTFPQGSVVGLNSWVAHNNPNVFDEPDCFRPERWIKNGEGGNIKLKAMEAYFCPVSDSGAQEYIVTRLLTRLISSGSVLERV